MKLVQLLSLLYLLVLSSSAFAQIDQRGARLYVIRNHQNIIHPQNGEPISASEWIDQERPSFLPLSISYARGNGPNLRFSIQFQIPPYQGKNLDNHGFGYFGINYNHAQKNSMSLEMHVDCANILNRVLTQGYFDVLIDGHNPGWRDVEAFAPDFNVINRFTGIVWSLNSSDEQSRFVGAFTNAQFNFEEQQVVGASEPAINWPPQTSVLYTYRMRSTYAADDGRELSEDNLADLEYWKEEMDSNTLYMQDITFHPSTEGALVIGPWANGRRNYQGSFSPDLNRVLLLFNSQYRAQLANHLFSNQNFALFVRVNDRSRSGRRGHRTYSIDEEDILIIIDGAPVNLEEYLDDLEEQIEVDQERQAAHQEQVARDIDALNGERSLSDHFTEAIDPLQNLEIRAHQAWNEFWGE